MTTIHNLQMLAVDLEQRVVREMQLQGDAERQIVEALATAREAFNHLENVILSAFQERSRALAATLGTGKPSPDTFESAPVKPHLPPKVKKEVKPLPDTYGDLEDKWPKNSSGTVE
jgi:hypothetical protein